ncbi:ECF transporter S component [Streptococcus loxodontisalivarius]|uniref:Membrane protein n=1 Tax=Streptococcus loxodontisalivarius TaxID=1349415 RepID=A0ABS2PRI5_9STRE|nr:ECF transporter S component [Streptococcus loxodontisalivarius]MBM7642548.1 putative membrane protein [Streptococcus loxodontisalivarius]
MSLKIMTRCAILAALCIVLRQAFAFLPNIQPITSIFLLISIFWSLEEGILVVSLTMLISSFLLGFGPWVFYQIISFSLVLMLWSQVLVPLAKSFRLKDIGLEIVLAILAASMGIIYGILIDSISAWFYQMPWWTYVLAGMPYNLAHAFSTAIFFPIIKTIFRRLYHEKDF